MAIRLTSYTEAREALRCRELRQALYDAGHRLMTGVIVNLHGDAHVARRRLENRLFRRDTFAWYEADRMPAILDTVLAGPLADGHGDLPPLARRAMMTLSVDVAGVDLPSGAGDDAFDPAVFERFFGLMERLARASTVAHATGDPAAIIAAGDDALAEFERDFYSASHQRRADLLARFDAGDLPEDDLPRDVLTTLLRNQDRLDLPAGFVLREIAYFPWVGSHSTSGQFVHAMHHMFEWLAERPADRRRLADDDEWRQQFVHESMRLHPASPVALRTATTDVTLKSGRTIAAGETVEIDLERANRDVAVFGDEPDRFDPSRPLADGAAPWGLSFGHGAHACLGQELAAGMLPADAEHHLLGAVVIMSGRMLAAGARPDPDDPPELDTSTTRRVWSRYPVRFNAS